MLKRFFAGLVFGLGISISFVAVLSLWLFVGLPQMTPSGRMTVTDTSSKNRNSSNIKEQHPEYIENFHELPIDDQITKSTAIIVTKIEKDKNGKFQQVVAEVLKKQEGVELYYKVGDLYNDHVDYNEYEEMGRHIPEGFVVFMTGSPASWRYSVSYQGERVGTLHDISIALLREKCDP